jgi:hypothetical protein
VIRRRIFADMSSDEKDGVPDGMKVDVNGRIYCTGPGGTWVFAPDGTRLGIIRTPEVPANLAFGGPDLQTLFFTARTSVYSLRVTTPGQPHPWYRGARPLGPPMSRRGLILLFACLLGIPVGVGAFTFVYAKGFSYLSTDPKACVNCHIMNSQYDAWNEEWPPPRGRMRGLPSAPPRPREVGGEVGARLPPFDGVHPPELQRADRDHAEGPAHRAGQLRALPRRLRPRRVPEPGTGRRGAPLHALPRRGGAFRGALMSHAKEPLT